MSGAMLHVRVDTSPMAQTVGSIKKHIIGVTAAVTAMEAAVIANERISSQIICENVDKGFYMLVKSQISQKAVTAYTEMTSKEVVLVQLNKALDKIKTQMQTDYAMISRRYYKLFQSLNKMLEGAVKELDKYAMKIAGIKNTVIFDKLKNESSLLFNAANDTASASQLALGARLRQKSRETLKTMQDFSAESDSYSKKLEGILWKTENGTDNGDERDVPTTRFLPSVFFVAESFFDRKESVETVYAPQHELWQNDAPIIGEIGQTGDRLPCVELSDEEKKLVKNEFVILCERNVTDTRIAAEMRRLFNNASWEVLENGL